MCVCVCVCVFMCMNMCVRMCEAFNMHKQFNILINILQCVRNSK